MTSPSLGNTLGKFRWASLAGKEERIWASTFATAWRAALRTFAPAGKEALRHAIAKGASGRGIDLHTWFEGLRPAVRVQSVHLDAALKQMQASKLKVTLLYLRNRPTIIVHKTAPSEWRPGELLPVGYRPLPFDFHKVPYLSSNLRDATGFDWLFEPQALDHHEVARIVRAGREALKDPAIAARAKAVAKDIASAPSAQPVIKLHWPVRFPQFAKVAHAFREGRTLGWLATLEAAADTLSVLSFASFLQGRNPGFVASVLFTNPWVGFGVGYLVNKFVGDRAERRAKHALRRAEREYTLAVLQADYAKMVRASWRARQASLVAKSLVGIRYGVVI